MPFKFSGEAPALGSTSDAFTPFSLPTSSATSSPRLSAFGTTPPFGAASSFGDIPTLRRSSSFATSLSIPPPSRTTTTSQHGAAPYKPKDDMLSKSLHRMKYKHQGIFGAEIAADHVVSTYLESMQQGQSIGEVDSLNKLETMLTEMAECQPEAMRFLRHVFERAATSNGSKPARTDSQHQEDEAGHIPAEAPDSYTDVHRGSQLYKACQTAINEVMNHNHFYHYRSHSDIGADVTNVIADGASTVAVKRFLSSGAYGRFAPSTNLALDEDELVAEVYETVLKVKQQFRDGWKVEGKEEASYFGKGLEEKKTEAPMKHWDGNREAKNPSALCCPFADEGQEDSGRKRFENQPFRFMDLPPELRNHVYRNILAPGSVCLLNCSHHNPRGTSPRLAPSILTTSKQVYEEAADLLFENKFLANLVPHRVPRGDALHRAQLPLHVLPKIQKLVLVIDHMRFDDIISDFMSLQALTSLTTPRIIAIEEEVQSHASTIENLSAILTEILTRIPAGCNVYYGSAPAHGARFTRHMIRVLRNKDLHLLNHRAGPLGKVKETDADKLKEAAKSVSDDVVQGAKSGQAQPAGRKLPGDLKGVLGMNA